MSAELKQLQRRIKSLERELTVLRGASSSRQDGAPRTRSERRVIRKRSKTEVWGWPLWEIARGPDRKRGQPRGHARAIFAIGDRADGVVALGGVARGVVAVGGVSFGVLALGGVAISLVAAIGGVAVAPLAYGGAAIGGITKGGAAVGFRTNRSSEPHVPAVARRRHRGVVRSLRNLWPW